MTDERLQILKMVEEGKVSAAEATKLLEAVEQAPKPSGRTATHFRVLITEGTKVINFSVGTGLARWILSLPVVNIQIGEERIDVDRLLDQIDRGYQGKILDLTEGNKKLEIWLDP